MVNFKDAREIFRDVVDLRYYVPLNSSEKKKIDLLSAIENREKMIILKGEAGSGKSVLLQLIYNELKDKRSVFYVSNPYLEVKSIINFLKSIELDSHHVVLLDEAQLLSEDTWENLRIYADRGNVTIVFATHDTNLKKLFEKKHFKTRINYVIALKRVDLEETENFIISKLIRSNLDEVAKMFSKSNFKKIYKYSQGSLRATNQLLFKTFDVMDYFYTKNPAKFNLKRVENKYIEVAIMDLRESHA